MAERMIKTIKHGITVFAATPANIQMEKVTSILRKAVDCASSKMPMVTNGRDIVETSKSFMLHQTR
jgi:hypothetical protein